MTVQSKLDEGTIVTVALPLAFVRPEAAEPENKITTLTPASRAVSQDQTVQDQTIQVKKRA
jgi:cell cycle sensor histidine kinase DivJ